MFRIKFPTKRIFPIFPVLKINGMAPFCKLIYRTTLVYSDLLGLPFCEHPCSVRTCWICQNWWQIVH